MKLIEVVIGKFAVAAQGWVQNRRSDALKDQIKVVMRVAEDVMRDVDQGPLNFKVRLLNVLARGAASVNCDATAQKICDAQMSVQSANVSQRVLAMVSSLKEGHEVFAHCGGVASVLRDKPTLNDQAKEVLDDTRGMCEAAIKGAFAMSTRGNCATKCLKYTNLSILCKFICIA